MKYRFYKQGDNLFFHKEKGLNQGVILQTTYLKYADNKPIPIEDWVKQEWEGISESKFNILLNKWHNKNTCHWEHNGVKYKTLDAYDDLSFLYKQPMHQTHPEQVNPIFARPLVWHRMKIWFAYSNGTNQLWLERAFSGKSEEKWTNYKNCKPIFNCETKKII
jgi:hypothetical protein